MSDALSLTENDLSRKRGLPAREVDRRLVCLARAHRQVESALCFYLQEVETRKLYLDYGYAGTLDYARERLGFEERKTRSLVHIALRLEKLPELRKTFGEGELGWTKVREVVKVATPETENGWLEKCRKLSNRQLEQEVRKELPPVRRKTLVLVLEGEMADTWQQTREALERLSGKSLTDLEVFDLMCAEVLGSYAVTPPFDPEDESDGGYLRSIAERDGWKYSRPAAVRSEPAERRTARGTRSEARPG
jgi:hypothetical protein